MMSRKNVRAIERAIRNLQIAFQQVGIPGPDKIVLRSYVQIAALNSLFKTVYTYIPADQQETLASDMSGILIVAAEDFGIDGPRITQIGL